jgi:Peptidase inhibitor family I36
MNGFGRKILAAAGTAAAVSGVLVVSALPASAAPAGPPIGSAGNGLNGCFARTICFWTGSNFQKKLDDNDDSQTLESVQVLDDMNPNVDRSLPDFGKLKPTGFLFGDSGIQDASSSVANKTGEPWCIFTDNKFQGRAKQINPNDSIPQLEAGFDNQVSSAKPGPC